MVSPERLERYRDFVDPDLAGVPYDPRSGLERLLGILSPDTKGILLAAMDQDWYGSRPQLRSRINDWLEEQGLPGSVWPVTLAPTWQYLELVDKNGDIKDGSLVKLGAVVKKIEPDPFQRWYQRSSAGAELAIPLVQNASRFVSIAREYSEKQILCGFKPHKFDSMWRIIGSVNSTTDERRSLIVFDVIDYLVRNPGKYREVDFHHETHYSQGRLGLVLSTLGNCGVIDYESAEVEQSGRRGKGWSVYILDKHVLVGDIETKEVYQKIKHLKNDFYTRAYLTSVIDYIKSHPVREYEYNSLAEVLKIDPNQVSGILSLLENINILARPDTSFNGSKGKSAAEANELTRIFHDLVCEPAKEVAETLSALPSQPWNKTDILNLLQNYREEKSHYGPHGGVSVRELLLKLLSVFEDEIKLSYIIDLYNDGSEIELKSTSIGHQLRVLMKLGLVEQSKPGYFQIVRK